MTHLLELQMLLMTDARKPTLKASVRAQVARAWDVLEERKRILRGIPLPGMFRPTLDPAQLAKQLRKGRIKQSIDVPSFRDASEAKSTAAPIDVSEPDKGIS